MTDHDFDHEPDPTERPLGPTDPSELDPEAPEADLAEQLRPLRAEDEEPVPVPLEADPADVAEQHRQVELDEEDDR